MSLLFETICCQNRQLFNLDYHNQRLNQSRFDLLNISKSIDLQDFKQIPDWVGDGLYRCRVSYDFEIKKVEFFEYQIKHPKKIGLIESPNIDYSHKYENRQVFQDLLIQNPEFDDVIILQNGFLTDSTYANIALSDGENWFTPKTYLLKGTKRSYLIDNQLVIEKEIHFSEFINYKKIALINAMRDLEICYKFEIIDDLKTHRLSLILHH
jgi:4-amino-4-deoxychorismate lyase